MRTNLQLHSILYPGLLLALVSTTISCKKDALADAGTSLLAPPALATSVATEQLVAAVNSSWQVNWNNYSDGTYPATAATTDFGNAGGWVNNRAWISAGTLRITVLPNRLSDSCGILSNISVASGSEYELDYDVRFHSLFDWSRGGKLGFGFLIGEGNTGGAPGWGGDGGSIRLIWYQTTQGRVFFQPYVYYKDQPGENGDDFGVTYPATGTLSKAKWYHVHMYVKSNTGDNYNGHALVAINGTTLLDTGIRWTTNDSERLINSICFHTFRGGSTTDWESASMGYIYYDNLVVHKIN